MSGAPDRPDRPDIWGVLAGIGEFSISNGGMCAEQSVEQNGRGSGPLKRAAILAATTLTGRDFGSGRVEGDAAGGLNVLDYESIQGQVLLPLSKLSRLPYFAQRRGEAPLSPSTPGRWAMRGVRGPNGKRIKLAVLRLPSGLHTTERAVFEFLQAQTDPQTAQVKSAAAGRNFSGAMDRLEKTGFIGKSVSKPPRAKSA